LSYESADIIMCYLALIGLLYYYSRDCRDLCTPSLPLAWAL